MDPNHQSRLDQSAEKLGAAMIYPAVSRALCEQSVQRFRDTLDKHDADGPKSPTNAAEFRNLFADAVELAESLHLAMRCIAADQDDVTPSTQL